MKVKILGFLAGAAILLSGCSSAGGGEDKFSASYVQSHIVKGKTTKAEVQQLYGVPDGNSKSSGGTDWTYNKNADYSSISSLTSNIPGAGTVFSALGTANIASRASSKAENKRSGNTETQGTRLSISFDNNDVVDHWLLW